MKVKLKNQYNQWSPGKILSVAPSFVLPVRDESGFENWIPEYMLEAVDEGGKSPSEGGSLISVTQEMKSLNIEFK